MIKRFTCISSLHGIEQTRLVLENQEVTPIYVTHDYFLHTSCLIDHTLKKHELPVASGTFTTSDKQRLHRSLHLGAARGRMTSRLTQLLKAQQGQQIKPLALIPVQVFWGSFIEFEKNASGALHREQLGWFKRLWRLMRQRKNVHFELGEPVVIESNYQPENAQLLIEKLQERHTTAYNTRIGPRLPSRKELLQEIVDSPSVKQMIESISETPAQLKRNRKAALAHANNICSHVYNFYRQTLRSSVAWFFKKARTQIVTNYIDDLAEKTQGYRVVYVPNHRSHLDYLILGLTLYDHFLPTPHIIAGENLNMPIAGRILRGAGAVFIKRSFRGSKLYTAVFDEYIRRLIEKEYPLAYFIEGSRSRTGRMLPAKIGLLRTTLSCTTQHGMEKLRLIPVSIGYDKLLEQATYAQELSGLEKKTESAADILRTIKQIKKNHGNAYMSFGDPIDLDEFVNEKEDSNDQIRQRSRELGIRIQREINRTTIVAPINLIATILLASPRLTLDREILNEQIDFLCQFVKQVYHDTKIYLPFTDADEVVKQVEDTHFISTSADGFVVPDAEQVSALASYRNNVAHLFTLPGLIASLTRMPVETEVLRKKLKLPYQLVNDELILPWDPDQYETTLDWHLESMSKLDLLSVKGDHIEVGAGGSLLSRMGLLRRTAAPALERHYLVFEHIDHKPCRRKELELNCRKVAGRINTLLGVSSAEYQDSATFKFIISEGLDREILVTDEGQLISPGEKMPEIHEILDQLLSPTFTRCANRIIQRNTD